LEIKTLVDEVSLGSQEQTDGIGQISKALTRMESVTQGTAANAEESAAAAEQLSSQSEALNELVTRLSNIIGGSHAAEVARQSAQQRRGVKGAISLMPLGRHPA
jgi:methyl-accepting chemotaxis protein/methyl-accepting chemotaxis protein-1 (serine sensor receptor)